MLPACAPPPQQDQFLSFSHMFLPKSVGIRGWHPPNGLAPPQMGNPGSATDLRSVSTTYHQLQLQNHITALKHLPVKCLRCFLQPLQGQMQDLIRGGPQIVTGLNCHGAQQHCASEASPFKHGVLGISLLNMHSLHFGVPFYTIFEIIKY